MNHYILYMRAKSFCLIGPFPSQKEAAEWGGSKEHNPLDIPTWQVLELDDPHRPVRVVSPNAMRILPGFE